MIDRLRDEWARRNAREQRLLAVMFALLAAVILWFGIVTPLKNARLAAQARLDAATVIAGQVSARADALRRSARAVPAPLEASLVVAVGSTATEAGFTPTRLDPQGEDRVVIAISSARSIALFAWLDGLARRGVFAERIALRPNSDGTVSCEATLRLRRR
ncbi:type II secretion system protein GspM [Sphingomonas sp.]|uniref:type II secretion system protein GspM n=1 Tax=Sphingomonas sp. TaxID=28214 RepID=UPI0025E3420B|nr:type II secretion system protein GspM [Sphingomonas sp.]